jgi:1-acyl-sn-glycerol-3-phosphate acyltransferase
MTEPSGPGNGLEPPTVRPSRIRAAVRVALLLAWTAACGSVALAARLGRRLAPGASRTLRTLAFRAWGKGFLAVLGARVEVRGTPPKPPFLLVTNHLSYVDVPLLASLTRCVFVSKHQVEGMPGFGALARAVDTIFIRRDRPRDALRVLDQMDEARTAGDGVVFFPESTTSRGDRIAALKPALLDAAVRTGQPIHFGIISYRTPPDMPPAHQVVCWWGDMTFRPHFLALLGYPGFTAYVTFGSETVTADDRKTLAARLRTALEREFVPVVPRESN